MTAPPALPPFPEIVEVELTRRCNLECRMCQRQVVRAPADEADLREDLLGAILDGCAGHAPQINLGGLGESLLHGDLPRLFAMIKAHDPRIRTGFNTNGLLLSDTAADWMLDGRVDFLSVSLNAPDAPGYRRLTGRDAHAGVVRRARAFLRRKGRGNRPLTTVHIFRLPAFAESRDVFLREWEELADFVQERELGNWAGMIDRAAFTPAPLVMGLCDRPWLSLAIDLSGGYHRCCATFALEQPRTTIHETGIREYWLGQRMKEQRDEMLSGRFGEKSPCGSCSGRAIQSNTAIERAFHHHAERRGGASSP